MIRRLKKEVLDQLAPTGKWSEKQRQKIFIGMRHKHSDILKNIIIDLRQSWKKLSGSKISDTERSSLKCQSNRLFMELYRNSGVAKVPNICQYIKDLCESGHKFVVFAHHHEVLEGIANFLKSSQVEFIHIDGATPQNKRHLYVQLFQENPNCRVALLSITACGTGLTLTAASQVVFAELFWNPGALLQAEDRVHRIGQKNNVVIQYLIAKDSFDEICWDVVGRKLDVLSTTLNGCDEYKLSCHHQKKYFPPEENLESPPKDSFIQSILEVIDTYEERMGLFLEKRERNRQLRLENEKMKKNIILEIPSMSQNMKNEESDEDQLNMSFLNQSNISNSKTGLSKLNTYFLDST